MATLVLVFCFGSGNVQCVEQRPVYEEPLSIMTCMVRGQFGVLSSWQPTRIGDWRAGVARQGLGRTT